MLKPVEGDKTRRNIRARATCTPRWILPFVEVVLRPADWLKAASMLAGVRKRVEGR